MLRIGIVGAGAIGCLFGGFLAREGNSVTLIHRDRRVVAAIRKKGVRVHDGNRTFTANVKSLAAPANLAQLDVVLFTVKAYDTRQAAGMHKGLIERDATIVSLQNGLGNLEALRSVFRKNIVLAGSTTEASREVAAGEVVRSGIGKTLIGSSDEPTVPVSRKIVRELNHAGIRARWSSQMKRVLWEKAILNSAVNPVSAITRLRNGSISGVESLRTMIMETVVEGASIASAEGVSIEPVRLFRKTMDVLTASSSNQSSMLQDVLNGSKTEIHELNGMLVDLGSRNGIATPYNSGLAALILGIESAYESDVAKLS